MSLTASFSLTFVQASILAVIGSVPNLDDAPEPNIVERPDHPPMRDISDLPLTTKHPPHDRPARAIFLPLAISERDLERYERLLELSEEQANFLRVEYEEYRRETMR